MSSPPASLPESLRTRYTIERELGRGGMATVYLATDHKLHRHVALKVVRPELAASFGTERFLREIEISARLSHPHILPLHDSGEADGRLFYAMPYVEGESLRQRLEREAQLSIADVIAIVRAVASALTYAHQQGIIHRDIKPENILLARSSGDGTVHPLVADFGIARALDMAGRDRLTETGIALGTPAYMSPEQAAAGSRLDGRSDIYSLGCVAYEMLAGEPPFTGPTAQSILARHAVDPVPPLHTVRTTIPAAVEAAIEQALAKVPADRFATAEQFAEGLSSSKAAPPLWRRRGRRRALLVLGGVLAAAAAGIGGLRLRGAAQPLVTPAAATMAILPFSGGTADSGLARLGKDLALTVSASLDGVGGIKTTDRLSVAGATAEKPSLSAAEGAAVAKRLGASSVVRGTLVGSGDRVRLDLGLYRTDGLAPLGEGITVSGHRDSLGALTDSVAWALLRQIWQRGEVPSPSLSAVTTKSLPALRAFLEGERNLVSSHWEDAALAYRSAMSADSTFWLAYFGYALARDWIYHGSSAEPTVIQALGQHRKDLPEREQLLVDGFLVTDRTPRAKIEAYRRVTQRFPQYWPGWFLYADVLLHKGPVTGYDWSEALDAFRRVVALNPELVPAWEHIWNLATGRDRAEASRARARLFALGYPPPANPGYGRWLRLVDSIDSAGDTVPTALDALADTMVHFWVSTGDEELALYSPLALERIGFPKAQLQLNRRALALSDLRVPVRAAYLGGNAWSWATRGGWDSALVYMDSATAAYQGTFGWVSLPVESYGLAVLGAWIGALDSREAERRRGAATAAVDQLSDEGDGPRTKLREERGKLAWLDGLLGFSRRDRRAIQAARAEAAQSGFFRADLIDRSLGAFDRALAGDRVGAGRELARLEEECIGDENCPSMTPHIAVERMMAAEWLLEAGEVDAARRLLRWEDYPDQGWAWTFNDGVSGPAFLMRARIEETSGGRRLAREYYQQFLRHYDHPIPAQAHLVEEAKAALARLQTEPHDSL